MITKIRNLSIIAHIDHGKSTLADRLIEFCGGVKTHNMKDRILDSMELEKERGITIKAQTVRLMYHANNNETYIFNLMDTPGHVDFSYEVSRCLSACEGVIVVVDASQGVEAQTLSNVYMAIEQDRFLLPVLNKIDLPSADIDSVSYQIEEVLGLSVKNLVKVSAKSGEGIGSLLQAIVDYLPAPDGDEFKPLQALLVDSWYNSYLGVICLVRIMNGSLQSGKMIRMMNSNASFLVERIGIFTPKMQDVDLLRAGEIGYFIANIKTVKDCCIGDTITYVQNPCQHALPGFKPSLPVVFCGLFPVNTSEFLLLKDSLDKLALNDSSFSYQKENSTALGLGFRCGFLGLLHLEIVQERLEREFNLELVSTAPSVIYHVFLKSGEMIILHNPSDFPDYTLISYIEEPWIKSNIISPKDYIGDIMVLCKLKRGIQKGITYIAGCFVLQYCFPLNEIVFDFYDRLKSISRGYASFDYELSDYQISDLVKVQILINQESVDALATLVHRTNAELCGRNICKKLKSLIPRQLYQVAIQAAIGGKIIARETVSALKKDVTAKCYGGDISRKRKLLEKQKMGKKRMRSIGKVNIPYNAFIKVLRFDA